MPIIAETKRLLLRTWELKDVAQLCTLTEQEGFSEFSISGYANYSTEQATEWIHKEMERYEKLRQGKFAVILKAANKPIGISGLFQFSPDEAQVELNYRYPREYRGHGYATEGAQALLEYGFNILKLPEIYANVDIRNLASQKVLARLGMKWVGEISYAGVQAHRYSITRANGLAPSRDPLRVT